MKLSDSTNPSDSPGGAPLENPGGSRTFDDLVPEGPDIN